jgi:Tfp pilus assembly PilM family ATPase
MNNPRAASKRLSPIGLDIGFGEVRAVQLARGPGGVSLVCAAVFPRPGGPRPIAEFDGAEAAAVGAVLGRRGFVGRRVALTAPHGACTAYAIELPPKDSGAPISEIARAEIARKERVSPTAFEMATWYLPSRGRSERGMAVACEGAVLESYLKAFDHAGLVPVSVDLQECALARVGSQMFSGEDGAIHAMIIVGWSTTLAVLTLGRTVVYTRRFDIGVGYAVTRLKERGGLSWADAARVLDSGDPSFSDARPADLSPVAASPLEQSRVGGYDADERAAHDEPPGNHPVAAAATETDIFERSARAMWSELGASLSEETDTAITYVTHAHRNATVGCVMVGGYGAHRAELIDTMDHALGMPVTPAHEWPGASSLNDRAAARVVVAAGLAARFDQ